MVISIRVGAVVDDEITFNKKIIDYATSGNRSDKLDLFYLDIALF